MFQHSQDTIPSTVHHSQIILFLLSSFCCTGRVYFDKKRYGSVSCWNQCQEVASHIYWIDLFVAWRCSQGPDEPLGLLRRSFQLGDYVTMNHGKGQEKSEESGAVLAKTLF